ncbi:MAG: indole-3-glycerol-phosphate synthase [Nitrososphaerota archaeon]
MGDILDIFAEEAWKRLSKGYYNTVEVVCPQRRSLAMNIRRKRGVAVIAELKPCSPSAGALKENFRIRDVASAMERGGAVGLSVITVPERFGGHIVNILQAKSSTSLPVLMKDFIVGREQVLAASKAGADAVLLIYTLFNRGYVECDVDAMVAYAHALGLEVLLETHSEEEYLAALSTQADMVGVNNRDLRSLNVDLDVTRRILALGKPPGRVLVSESGIACPDDVWSLKALGVDAFLIGTAIMRSDNIEDTVRRFVEGGEGESLRNNLC